MARPDKVEQVELLTEKLKSARVAVLTDYRGLSVAQLQDLRGRLRAQSIEYRVIKNTLARRAAVEAGHEQFQDLLKGPVGIAFGYGEPGVPAKVLGEKLRVIDSRYEPHARVHLSPITPRAWASPNCTEVPLAVASTGAPIAASRTARAPF